MVNLNKTPKRNLSDSDSELESRTEFLSIMGSLEEKSLANLSPFVIEKVITYITNPQTLK